MNYQRISLATGSLVGEPGPLPPGALGLDDSSLADLSWVAEQSFGFDGVGYWPVIDEVPEHDPETHGPDGSWSLEVRAETKTVARIAGLALLPPPPPPSVDDVIAERDRRLALGFEYDFGDARGIHHIGTTVQDMQGWDEVTKVAAAALATGNSALEIQIITDTGPTTVTAMEWQAILLASGAARQPLWQASFVLQLADPIPADYADDVHWA